jgi:hypothetical protein
MYGAGFFYTVKFLYACRHPYQQGFTSHHPAKCKLPLHLYQPAIPGSLPPLKENINNFLKAAIILPELEPRQQ